MRKQRLVALLCTLAAGCAPGSSEQNPECAGLTIDTACAETTCRSLDEQIEVSESLCDQGLSTFAHVLVSGCGFTELRTLGPLGSDPDWFDTETGDLVGFTWLSDTAPDCNGTFVGNERPPACESVEVPECTLCGWDTCEWEACPGTILNCGFAFPCTSLWECSRETGCEGAECADEEVCPGFSLANADGGLEALDALLSCVDASGCTAECPLSMRVRP